MFIDGGSKVESCEDPYSYSKKKNYPTNVVLQFRHKKGSTNLLHTMHLPLWIVPLILEQ